MPAAAQVDLISDTWKVEADKVVCGSSVWMCPRRERRVKQCQGVSYRSLKTGSHQKEKKKPLLVLSDHRLIINH